MNNWDTCTQQTALLLENVKDWFSIISAIIIIIFINDRSWRKAVDKRKFNLINLNA